MLGVFLSHCCPTLGRQDQLLAQPFATCVSGWAGSGGKMPVVISRREFINGFLLLRTFTRAFEQVRGFVWVLGTGLSCGHAFQRAVPGPQAGCLLGEEGQKALLLATSFPSCQAAGHCGCPGTARGSRADRLKPSHPLDSEVISEVEMKPTHQVNENSQYLRD